MIGTGRLGDKCTGRYLAVVNYTLNGGITRYDVAENTRGRDKVKYPPGNELKESRQRWISIARTLDFLRLVSRYI